MSCGMSPVDVRRLLEGYCLDERQVTVVTCNTVDGSDVLTVSGTPAVLPLSLASGTGIPDGAYVLEVSDGFIRISAAAIASGTGVAVAFTQYKALSDDWIVNTRDLQVIPVVERATGLSLSGVKRVVEIHSGTGSTLIMLNRRPIVDIFSINLITNPQNWVYVSPSSIEPVREEGILKLRAVLESWQNYVPAFPRGKDNIKIDYSYGYAQAPDDIMRAVCMLTASFALGMLGSRTGGGSLGVQGFNRSYGSRGKYHDARQELDRWAHSILRKYMTSMVGQ